MFQYIPYLLILIGASARLLPHAPNFTPIAALALFGAVYLRKRDGLWVPLVAMFLSDWVIGFYHPLVMASVYGSFVLVGLLGVWLRARWSAPFTAHAWEPGRLVSRFRNGPDAVGVKPSRKLLGSLPRSRSGGNSTSTFGRWGRLFGCSMLGSILFFLITNWAVWAWGALYPKTLEGLIMSYWMGLPFFRNTLLGDLFYVAIFFGIAELVPFIIRLRYRKRLVTQSTWN